MLNNRGGHKAAMKTTPDPLLEPLRAAASGGDAEWQAFLEAAEPAMRRLARMGCRHRPDDSSEVYVRMVETLARNDRHVLRTFEGRCSVRSFLFHVMRSCRAGAFRARLGRRRPPTGLSALESRVYLAVYFDGYTPREAAHVLGIEADVVQQALVRIRSKVDRSTLMAARTVAHGVQAIMEPDDELASDPDPEQRVLAAEQLSRLRAALRRLPPGDRDVVAHELSGGNVMEYARCNGVGKSSLYRRVHAIRDVLRADIEGTAA